MEIKGNKLIFKIGCLEFWNVATTKYNPEHRTHIGYGFFRENQSHKICKGSFIKAVLPLEGERLWFKVLKVNKEEQTIIAKCDSHPIDSCVSFGQDITIPFQCLVDVDSTLSRRKILKFGRLEKWWFAHKGNSLRPKGKCIIGNWFWIEKEANILSSGDCLKVRSYSGEVMRVEVMSVDWLNELIYCEINKRTYSGKKWKDFFKDKVFHFSKVKGNFNF